MVGSYKDTGDIKKVQSSGLHIAGERYVVIKADDRSLYGKKVACILILPSLYRALTGVVFSGQRGHRHRQNATSHPRQPLSGVRPTRVGGQYGGAVGRLFDWPGLLSICMAFRCATFDRGVFVLHHHHPQTTPTYRWGPVDKIYRETHETCMPKQQ